MGRPGDPEIFGIRPGSADRLAGPLGSFPKVPDGDLPAPLGPGDINQVNEEVLAREVRDNGSLEVGGVETRVKLGGLRPKQVFSSPQIRLLQKAQVGGNPIVEVRVHNHLLAPTMGERGTIR